MYVCIYLSVIVQQSWEMKKEREKVTSQFHFPLVVSVGFEMPSLLWLSSTLFLLMEIRWKFQGIRDRI